MNAYVPTLQTPGAVVRFLTEHRGNPIPSPALFNPIGNAFRRAVKAAYPVVADPWWNPFSWNWKRIGSKCGKGAAVTVIGTGTATTITNIGRTVAGKTAVMVTGGAWGYVGLAAGGCVVYLFT